MTAARRFLLLGDTSTATSSSHGAREAAASIRGLVRVVSLLPSATETLAAIVKLSLKNKANSTETTSTCTAYSASVSAAGVQLVGRSHECTHPLDFVSNVPILTSPRTEWTNSRNVHSQVTTALSSSCSSSLYSLDSTLLSHLNPHIILTQSDCQVCSIHVNAITTSSSSSSSHDFDDDHPPPIPINPRIITINSHTLTDALVDNVLQIGRAVGLDKEAQELVNQNLKRLDFIKQRVEERKKKKRGNSPPHPPRVMVVEWLDPVFLAQGWTRELVELAGGEYVVNAKDGR